MYAYARSFIPGLRIQGNTEFSDLQIGHGQEIGQGPWTKLFVFPL